MYLSPFFRFFMLSTSYNSRRKHLDCVCVVSVFLLNDILLGASHTGGQPQGTTTLTTHVCLLLPHISYYHDGPHRTYRYIQMWWRFFRTAYLSLSLFKEDMVEKQLSGVVRTNLCFEYFKQQILLPEREGVKSISA